MNSVNEYTLCIYWGIRPESKELAANKIAVYLNGLVALDDSFSSWFSVGEKRSKKHLLQIPFKKDAIALMLTINKTDIDNIPIPELGFGFYAWSGLRSRLNARISAYCGTYTKRVLNSVIISFSGPEFPSMELIRDIYSLMQEIFQPEAGVIWVGECFISESGEEEYKDRILESFGAIDQDGKVTINRS